MSRGYRGRGMWDFWARLFDSSGFPPRWQCGSWDVGLGWLHILADLAIWAAYFAIPCILSYYAFRRKDMPFRGVLRLFVAFILLCGLTHLLNAVLFWWPAYRLDGLLKLLTAGVSWLAVVALVRVTPHLLALRSPAELEREIAERKRAECELRALQGDLGKRVGQRTAELQAAVAALAADAGVRRVSETALRASEERFRVLFEQSSDAHLLFDEAGGILDCNPAAVAMLRCGDKSAVLSLHPAVLSPEFQPDGRRSLEKCVEMDATARRNGHHRFDWTHRRQDGDEFPCEVSLTPVAVGGQSVLLVVWHELTERARAEAALRESEERFRSAFEDAAVGMALVGLDGRWLRVNRSLCAFVGYGEAELLATDFQTLTHPADLDADIGFVRQLLAGARATYQMKKRYFHKDGHLVWVLLAVSLVRGGDGRPLYFVSQIQDITERTRAEEQVRASLREKEVLLKEIHHRVKNNLQIVSALLDLQSEHTADAAAREMFDESRGRVRSMALIHERLYRSTDLTRVDFGEYIRQLADDLYRNYKVSGADIRLDLAVDVPPLPLDLAIPCGLLLNELMSNCFKHAFPAAAEGCIRVDLRPAADGTNVLTVADDGAGFPVGTDFRNTHSFGLQLVNTLVEQLDGEITLTAAAGTTFTVRFPTIKGQPPDRTPAP